MYKYPRNLIPQLREFDVRRVAYPAARLKAPQAGAENIW